ncbi:MAG: TrkA family potassium uptake protein [Tissierellia bacterium]|nr:TrkA family potassium uptake protein [Tissierellia bacterium]
MKEYAVIGLGRFGESIAMTLSDLGHEVIVVEKSEEAVNKIADHVTHAICGDATDIEVLKSVGVGNVDVAIIAISSHFESSVMATIMCKELGIQRVVAKAKNETHATILKKVGADNVVIPERDMGRKLAHNLSSKNVVELFSLSSDFEILELLAPKSWHGSTISKLNVRAKYGLSILGIIKENEEFIGNPAPEIVIEPNDTLVVLGTGEDFAHIENLG